MAQSPRAVGRCRRVCHITTDGAPIKWEEWIDTPGSDIRGLTDWILQLDTDLPPYLRHLQRSGRLLLHRHWHRVEDLAARLVEDGKVDGVALQEYMTGLGRLGMRKRLRPWEEEARLRSERTKLAHS